MNYEYKELIKTYAEYIMDDYEVVDYIEAGKELNEVYRKAQAFDAVLKAYDEALSEGHMADEVCNIIEEYERGESE